MKGMPASIAAALVYAALPSVTLAQAPGVVFEGGEKVEVGDDGAQATAPPASAEEEEIVVEGQRNADNVINSYLKGITAANPNEPLARYARGDYCPATYGLSASSNKQITTRMRAVAVAAGVNPAEEDCVPSALVIFVDGKNEFLEKFRARHPRYFAELRGRGRPLLESEEPAVAWRLVQRVFATDGTGGGMIRSTVTPVITMSVVVVERRALIGLTTTQIADYVLMRSLTDQEPRTLNVPNDYTILKALPAPLASAVPLSLTKWDLAYLKGRYSNHPASYSTRQAATIRGMMRRALTETASE